MAATFRINIHCGLEEDDKIDAIFKLQKCQAAVGLAGRGW